MSTRTDEMKKKVKGFGEKAKDFVKDHKFEIAYYGAVGALVTVGIVYNKYDSQKCHASWLEAKKQLDSGNITDFGPYKICKFFEPDGTFMGQLPMHEKTTEAFLKFNNSH